MKTIIKIAIGTLVLITLTSCTGILEGVDTTSHRYDDSYVDSHGTNLYSVGN
jgi:hypothetical protein